MPDYTVHLWQIGSAVDASMMRGCKLARSSTSLVVPGDPELASGNSGLALKLAAAECACLLN